MKEKAPRRTSARGATKAIKLACVRTGFEQYVMPADRALKVVELMQTAFACEPTFSRDSKKYKTDAKTQPDLQLEILSLTQLERPLEVSMAFMDLFAEAL